VEPENGSALLGEAAAEEELCTCIISLLLAPSTAALLLAAQVHHRQVLPELHAQRVQHLAEKEQRQT